ncbi:MAG: hypothetical protein ACI4F4_03620 [Lachnospiraceae bacterium]
MKQICDYCGGYISETDEKCPNCGATNSQYKRTGDGVPKTIEELKAWYKAHHLPPEEETRFFIGKDYKEPKAFGIYQDGERFVVYKNKADGSRAIRYDGGDEAYAVNELYLKLKETIAEQKAMNGRIRSGSKMSRGKAKGNTLAGTILIYSLVAVMIGMIAAFSTSNGYYRYNNQQYYYLDDDWYIYDDSSSSWQETNVDSELSNHADDYFESGSYSPDYGTTDFEDTGYYSDWEESQNSDDWDSGSDWDSGDSWDSGVSDWNSDW